MSEETQTSYRRAEPVAQAVMNHIFREAADCVTLASKKPTDVRPYCFEDMPPVGEWVLYNTARLGPLACALSVLRLEERYALLDLYKLRHVWRTGGTMPLLSVEEQTTLVGLGPFYASHLGGGGFALTPLGYVCAYLCDANAQQGSPS